MHTASDNQSHVSPLSDVHLQHLHERGLTDATIAAASLWSADARQVADLLDFDAKSGGIVIPYFHPFTGEVVLSRVRPDHPPIINGKPAKYLSPKGVGNRVYFPPSAREWIGDPSVPIGITEGEFKTLWAYQVGLRYVGLIGVWGWKGKK